MSGLWRRRSLACQQLVEMVTDYLEGDLDPRRRAALEAHLAQCEHCTGYIQQVRRMLELTAGTLEEPADLSPDLLSALTSRYRQRH